MYNGTKVLDVHSHVRPLRPSYLFFTDLMHSRYALESPIGPGKHSSIVGMRDEDFQSTAASHAEYLDVRNIDTQILSPHPLRVFGWMEPYLLKTWISYVNDMIFKIAQAQPDRFVGTCQLPQNPQEKDTTHVLDELERCVDQYGFVATSVTPDITGKRDTPPMSEPYWYPLYEKCQELGVPIIVHGTDGVDPRYRSLPLQYYQMTFLTEQYMALATLRLNDQFQRFPGLKIIICHCGGALDRHIGDYPWLARDRDNDANLFYDTCAYDLDFLATAIHQRGVSQMCFGVEAPGGGTNNRPGTDLTADDMVPMITEHPTLDFLTEQDKMDILHNNPAKVAPGLVDAAATNAKAKVKAFLGEGEQVAAAPAPRTANPNPWGFAGA
ncbi:MAG: amidohydrolase family protein [Dehalococcoidia bacterium]